MKKKIVLLVFTAMLLFNSCNNNTKVISNINAYTEYILGFPEDRISTISELQFMLNKPVDVTKVSNDIVTTNPKVEGEVTLENNTITFTPNQQLENDKEYVITLHLSKIYQNIPKHLKDFTIKTKTKALLFSVALESPMVYNQDLNYINGVISASDVIQVENLSKLIKAKYNDKDIPITFDITTGLASKIPFKIDSISRQDKDEELTLKWNGKAINSQTKGKRSMTIIGKNTFKVVNVKVSNGANQQIDIIFSDLLKKNQNIKGLVNFRNYEKRKFTYKVHKNIIIIYPVTSFKKSSKLEVLQGVKNHKGKKLDTPYLKEVYFDDLEPSLSFINSGTILPDANQLKINFQAVNLKAVDATIYKIYKNNVLQFLQRNNLNNKGNIRYVGRPVAKYTIDLSNRGLQLNQPNAFAIDLANLVEIEEGAMYRVELSFNKNYSNYTCSEPSDETTIIYGKKEIDTSDYDNDEGYDYYEDYYDWDEREDPCTDSYYYHKSIKTNVLASNLGVIIKKGTNNNTFIAVSDLLTTQPVSGAKVSLYNLQQQLIKNATTDSKGIAVITNKQIPYFAVVTKGKSTTYVKLKEGNALSMSKFNVSGERLANGMQGYIYGERGVWRPGDTMYLTFVLNDNANSIPDKHPIKFELYNSLGKLIDRKVQTKKEHNIYTYKPTTSPDDITGNWVLKVIVGGSTFSKVLKVETIKPNRLKIQINTSDKLISTSQKLSADVKVTWLHGAVAKGLDLDITAKYYQTKTEFGGFKQYCFDDITRSFNSEEDKIFDGKLTNNGTAIFSIRPSLDQYAAGMLKASILTKVYESGGDFSTDIYTLDVSPYSSYIGLNIAEEKDSKNYLYTDKDYTFSIVNLYENGTAKSGNIEVNVYKLSWRWWWSSSIDGLSTYDGTDYHEPYLNKTILTNSNGKGSFNINIPKSDWGRYLIKLKDKSSGHVTSQVVYFDWPSWYGNKPNTQDRSNATMLSVTTDKSDYLVNDNINLHFPSSENARALITIENGVEVLDYFWVETKKKQTSFSFPVLETYAPNVFVNVSLLQPHSQTVNDLPIRMYGTVPVMVKNPKTELLPEITMPNEIKPESQVTIKVKEQKGRAMSYTIALVDDGLLDLTRFKTPDPRDKFFAKQSLGVKTWDIYDDVVGAYGGEINQILSIGGDEAAKRSNNKKANRFKPMVVFLGPFHLDAKGVNKHIVNIPQYIGSVRAMVVASNVSENAYGQVDKTVYVRKPLMLLASLPRKITPNEIVTLPVNVFAMKPNIKNVNISITPNKAFTLQDNKTKSIHFSQVGEQMVYFNLKVNDYNGIGNVKIKATSGNEQANYKVDIDVLNPNPLSTEITDFVLQTNQSKQLNLQSFGTEGTNKVVLELSTVPPINFTDRLDYLIRYPHGCIEQTTSSGFPQLFFNDIFQLDKTKTNHIEHNIKATIKRINTFQLSNGGLSYWQGGHKANDWGTSYAGHFMIEAEKKGYALPVGFKAKWIAFQKQRAREWRNKSNLYGMDFAQAYRLYTLALVNNPDLSSMNRLREASNISNDAKIRLALAYAIIGKQSIAKTILTTISASEQIGQYYNYGSKIRDNAMALETYVVLKDQVKAIKLAQTIAENLSSNNWMSTQTTAYALLSIAKYVMLNGDKNGIRASYQFNTNKGKANTSKAMFTALFEDVKHGNTFNIINNAKGNLYVRLFNKGILPVGKEKVIQRNLIVQSVYINEDNNPISVDSLSQGTNFMAAIKVSNQTNQKIENVALIQYIPSGWEIVNTRYTDFGSNQSTGNIDYIDIKDANISYYFSLKANEDKYFNVLLNASYLGYYYLPGTQCEAMYDNNYLSRNKGKWIKVVK